MAWLRTVAPQEAEARGGRLARAYAAARARAGRVAGIVRAMSLAPRTLDASMALYAAVCTGAALPRRRCELLAVVVSRANDCHY